MPSEPLLENIFRPELILDRLCLRSISGDIVEFGCGYGTFTIPAARRVSGTVYAFDNDSQMVAAVTAESKATGCDNIVPVLRDFAAEGTGLAGGSMAYAMLFNILHADESRAILAEVLRVLSPGGLLGVTHWRYGSAKEIEPRPEQLATLVTVAGFNQLPAGIIELPPWHYGIVFRKPDAP